MNLINKLKDCPLGIHLYTPICGDVILKSINEDKVYPIICISVIKVSPFNTMAFTKFGQFCNVDEAECLLFPSKDNHNWNTFVTPKKEYTFKPFDAVLTRDTDTEFWILNLYSHYVVNSNYPHRCVSGTKYKQCIPFENNEYLLGTANSYKL